MNTPAARVTLVIATYNMHKVGEIRSILGDGFRCLTLNDIPDAPKVVEDADTFAGNAQRKAVVLAGWLTGVPGCATRVPDSTFFVLADDSGLEVDALDGAPGVHSARFAALDRSADGSPSNSTDADNNAKLLRLLKDVPMEDRTARFRCVIALVKCNSQPGTRPPELFQGVCEGRICLEPRGTNGFGYDPLFVPDGFSQTFAELADDVKNRLSHRARALEALRQIFR